MVSGRWSHSFGSATAMDIAGYCDHITTFIDRFSILVYRWFCYFDEEDEEVEEEVFLRRSNSNFSACESFFALSMKNLFHLECSSTIGRQLRSAAQRSCRAPLPPVSGRAIWIYPSGWSLLRNSSLHEPGEPKTLRGHRAGWPAWATPELFRWIIDGHLAGEHRAPSAPGTLLVPRVEIHPRL